MKMAFFMLKAIIYFTFYQLAFLLYKYFLINLFTQNKNIYDH